MPQGYHCLMPQGYRCFMPQGYSCLTPQGYRCLMPQRYRSLMPQGYRCLMPQGCRCQCNVSCSPIVSFKLSHANKKSIKLLVYFFIVLQLVIWSGEVCVRRLVGNTTIELTSCEGIRWLWGRRAREHGRLCCRRAREHGRLCFQSAREHVWRCCTMFLGIFMRATFSDLIVHLLSMIFLTIHSVLMNLLLVH